MGHQGGYIFHIINIRIDIPVNLSDEPGGIVYGIVQNRPFRIIQGNDIEKSERCHDQSGKHRQHGGADTGKGQNSLPSRLFLFFLHPYILFSLAYSVGDFPMAFLKAALK